MTYTLPLSAAERWAHCPGSVALAAKHQLDDHALDPRRREEGTAAHWVVTQALRATANPAEFTAFEVGDFVPNGATVTQEMIDGAALFVATALEVLPDPATWRINERVRAENTIHPRAVGEVDLCGFDKDGTLHVLEFKFGHRKVEAFENWQGVGYVRALLDEAPSPAGFRITIVQPRYFGPGGPVRSWAAHVSELERMAKSLIWSAAEAFKTDPYTEPGDYCRTCPARHVCVTLQDAAATMSDFAAGAQAHVLTPAQAGDELAYIRRAIALLEARESGLTIEVELAMERGERVPGWEFQRSPGRERWQAGVIDQIGTLGEALGINLYKPRELITPGQARKAGISPDVIEGFTEHSSGERKLVPTSTNTTRQIFGGNKS